MAKDCIFGEVLGPARVRDPKTPMKVELKDRVGKPFVVKFFAEDLHAQGAAWKGAKLKLEAAMGTKEKVIHSEKFNKSYLKKVLAKELKITVLNLEEKPREITHKPLPFDKLFEGHRSLILVEDDESVARSAQYLLGTEPEFSKLHIHIARTLEEAKNMLEAYGKTAIVITDMSYPEKTGCAETPESGVRLIRYIKKRYPEIKIIANSGREDYLENAKKAGADFTMLKSEVATKLVDMIKGIQT